MSLSTFNSKKEEFLGKGIFTFQTVLEVDKYGFLKSPSIKMMIVEVKSKMTQPYLTEKETGSLRQFLHFLEKNI